GDDLARGEQPLEPRDDALVRGRRLAPPAPAPRALRRGRRIVGEPRLRVGPLGRARIRRAGPSGLARALGGLVAEEDGVADAGGEVAEGYVGVDAEGADGAFGFGGEREGTSPSPGDDGALAQGAPRVGDDALGIDAGAGADAVAGRAGAVRAVEREHPR